METSTKLGFINIQTSLSTGTVDTVNALHHKTAYLKTYVLTQFKTINPQHGVNSMSLTKYQGILVSI